MTDYFVDTAVGNDANAGTSAGSGNAWATIDKAMNTVVGGDVVNVKSSGSYAELATIDTAGSNTAPIHFVGYTGSPGDGGKVTVTGSSSRANCIADSLAANTRVYYVFENFIFTAATADGVNTDTNATFWKNCDFTFNGGDGFQGGQCMFENCKFEDNTAIGANIDRGSALWIGCRFYRNGTHGVKTTDTTTGLSFILAFCEFFSNGSNAVSAATGNDQFTVLINVTIDGDAKDTTSGLSLGNFRQLACIVNSVLYDCGTGVNSSANQGPAAISRNNLVNSNTADYSNFQTFTGEVTSAPAFNNEGANDYSPGSGSPMIAAGYDAEVLELTGNQYMDIGARQSVGAGSCNYPDEGNVTDGTVYANGSKTGNVVIPSTHDVEDGVTYGTSSTLTGEFVVPTPDTVDVAAGGYGYANEFVGTLEVPNPNDVRDGVAFGGDSAQTGDMVLPAEADVRTGVGYGSNATELTGSLAASSGGSNNIKSGGNL